MSKQAYSETVFDDSEPVGPPPVKLRIEGLSATGQPGMFELHGVKPRPIDARHLSGALGFEDPNSREAEEMVEAVCEFVFKRDLREILTNRIKLT